MKQDLESTRHARREFLRTATYSIGLALSATAISTIISACETDETPAGPTGDEVDIDISTYPELAIVGGIAIDLIAELNGDNPVFISRVDTELFAVFSAVCTHDGCIVDKAFNEEPNCVCPCHGSEYSRIDGTIKVQPSSGSATDLPAYSSSYDASTEILTVIS